jgi:hypothetical protein
MATQTIEFRAASGLTLTAELFAIGSDTIVATVSPTEQTNRAGTYRAIFTSVAAGEYQLVAFSGTTPVASWLVTLTLDTATFQTYDRATSINMRGTDNALLAASYTAPANSDITAIKTKTDQFVFTVANQVDANALTGGGGLDAAGVRAAVGLATANLDTQLADLPTVAEFEARTIVAADYFVVGDYTAPANSDITAIKTKTDQLAFTVANQVDSNALTGGGGLDASGIRAAVGLSSANLDTQLGDLPTNAEFEARSIPSADYFVVSDYTAPLDASGVRSAVGLATANLDTQLADLPTNAEFDARSLPSADYFVVSDYTTPPTVSQVADEVQTRTIARVTLVDTTTANTDTRGTDNALLAANYTVPPTASANATQVRTELTTELGRIDATISSRSTFAGGAVASVTDPVTVATNNDKTGYALATAPPTASEVATQVRTELSTELARVDATVSSRSTLTAANVWEHATRSLTTFGTLVSDIWSNATRTLTAISDSSGITTLLGRILGTLAAGTHEPQTGDSFARLGAPAGASIAADIAAIEGGGLTGDYTLTVTITDATDDEPIEAATVTLFRSGERGVEATDDEGEAVFGVDAATWSYVVRAAGYESATGTKVIAANDTLAVELTPIVVNQAAAPACNVVLPVIDQYLAPAAEVLVCIEFLSFLPNATKTAVIVNHPPSLLSDANGQVEVTLARLAKYRATYQVRNESPKRVEFSTPNAGSFIVVEA